LHTTLQVFPEMVFIVNALLILIQPPLKTMPIAFLDKPRLCEKHPLVAPILFSAPEIKAGTKLHGVAANEIAIP
jgi:hypothetical protein